ncbi:MAG: transcription elongation factor GreA, partial [Spirochaetales bacterium]|nr:transcription elongation factor GreA [Spirochaetales bacterium]
MSDLLDNLENFLKDEKWTRTTINNYTIKSFEDLDNQIDVLREEGLLNDALKLTDDYLKNNKNSIIALYLNSFINFKQGSFDDTNVLNLIKIFSDNLKWNIVEYLCNKTLLYFEDKYVIRILIDTCNNLNKKDLVFELMERLVKADNAEAEVPCRLAEM